jgi:outer membrane protein OmpA-like peptidoglycan-associated protein
MKHSNFLLRGIPLLIIPVMFFVSGCLATQDWVQTHVTEQLFPVNKRISDTEANVTQLGGRVSNVEGQVQTMSQQIADLDKRLNQTDAKADQALDNIQRLKLEKKMVLDLKQGAFFANNSTILTERAKRDIDSFLSDLKGDASGMGSLLFVVAGYTDNVGSEKYNYELGRLRADNVASYLATQKKIDPASLSVISFGENGAVADNATADGRAKNRRVEILVYRDSIGVGSAPAQARPEAKAQPRPANLSTVK